MTETTYERYQRVLQEIADGCDNPKERADAALHLPKPVPTYLWKIDAAERKKAADQQRYERPEQAKAFYIQWLKQDRPPISKFARSAHVHPSSMRRLLRHAERAMGLSWRERRLGSAIRNRRYDRVGEILDARDDDNGVC